MQLSGKEMTWAYLFQGTRIDENIKVYWFVRIIKLFISDLYVFIFEFFLQVSFAHLVHFFNLCIFQIASFCWGIFCYLSITALHQMFYISIISWCFHWTYFSVYHYYFDGIEYIKYVYSLRKKCFTQVIIFFIQ